MKLGFSGKVVVIFGASRGIGLALTRAFAEEDAKVTMIARDSVLLKKAADELAAEISKESIHTWAGDATKAEDVQKGLLEVVQRWEKIDVVIANVGDGRSVSEPMPAAERFSATWKTNFTSAEVVSREAIPHLEKSRGNLLFISSITGIEATGAPTDYSVAKSAIIALSKNLARKLAPNIRVNCIAPGNIFFPGGSWDEKIRSDAVRIESLIKTTVPLQRFGTPQEIADSALFLCSEKAGFTTGSCLIIDGGQTAAFH